MVLCDMEAYITGIGWVTSKNSGCIKDLDTFEISTDPLPDIPITDLGPAARRMDVYSRLGMSGILYALRDAGLFERPELQVSTKVTKNTKTTSYEKKRNIGIVTATQYACLDTDVAYYDSTSPALFSYTLPNTFLGEAAIHFGLTGPTYVINGEAPLGTGALEMALDSISSGETDTMLCGIANPPPPHALPDAPPVPLGALFFVVERQTGGRTSYGSVRFDTNGRIEFDGSEIGGLAELVGRSLKR